MRKLTILIAAAALTAVFGFTGTVQADFADECLPQF